MKLSIFERITNQIVDAISAGASEYVMPWHRTGKPLHSPSNAITGRSYRGLNILSLWIAAEIAGYQTGQWATYKQWEAAGAQVRRGERGTPIYFWERRAPMTDKADYTKENRPAFIAKCFTVFNADQVSGYRAEPMRELPEHQRLERAEALALATSAVIEHVGDCACYVPALDIIRMPPFARFRSAEGYYGVLSHELCHWTGAKHRLDRQFTGRFGSQSYAMEELIAELGAAFTCARLGISTEPRTDHAPYIASWLKVLSEDSRAIFAAASKAQEATDYLLSLDAASKPLAMESSPESRAGLSV